MNGSLFCKVALGVLLGVQSPARAYAQEAALLEVESGSIDFNSEAPKELIHARSTALRGVVDWSRRTFAFRLPIASFQGFNSPLQREHFNENYLESAQHPEASFTGKILEDIDLSHNGTYRWRAKGKLRIHGLEQERIVPITAVVKGKRVEAASDFEVPLEDHNIKIPRVVYDKLAPVIKVSVRAVLVPRS